jgi:molybdate transport system substrate-binding protein
MAAGSDVKTLTLPDDAQAVAQYPIAVVTASERGEVAQQFVDYVMSPPAQELLQRAGFEPPPSS